MCRGFGEAAVATVAVVVRSSPARGACMLHQVFWSARSMTVNRFRHTLPLKIRLQGVPDGSPLLVLVCRTQSFHRAHSRVVLTT
jgi:hypothetical protein